MPVDQHLNDDESILEIIVTERFDFACHNEFKHAYESLNDPADKIVVNLTDASYIDSSALGMLLLLRDYAKTHASQIQIANCQEDVKRILLTSKFDTLFELTETV